VICTAACGGGDGGPQHAAEEWRIDPEPLVAIGDVDAEDPYLFARIAGAGFVSDGRIVVADGMSGTIRVFHSDGRFDRQMGGIGDGPGEFRYLNSLRISDPDTIVAYDSQALRRTAFLATGELLSTVSFTSPDGWPEVYLGMYSDGSHAGAWIRQEPRDPSAVTADQMKLGRFDPDGRLVSILGIAAGMRRMGSPLPFSPHFLAAMVGDTVYHTDGLGGILEATGPSGESLGVVRVPGSEWGGEEALMRLETTLSESWSERLRDLKGLVTLDSVPAISEILADDEGRLWAKQYVPETDSHWNRRRRTGGEWIVVERDGSVVARVSVPDGVRPVAIRGSRILGVAFDEYDVERVQVHALERGRPAT
jgi:hypothetical protein